MIVNTQTGTYDDAAIFTAHDLAADHWWIEENYLAQAVNGRVLWEHAEYRRSQKTVLIWRIDIKNGFRAIKQYVDPETPMKLIKIKE